MFKFPYHNPYERIIVVVGSVVVVSLRSWHVFGVGGFLVFPAAGPCVCVPYKFQQDAHMI